MASQVRRLHRPVRTAGPTAVVPADIDIVHSSLVQFQRLLPLRTVSASRDRAWPPLQIDEMPVGKMFRQSTSSFGTVRAPRDRAW
jgi:hypothetical protein